MAEKSIRIHCNSCNRITNHRVEHRKYVRWEPDEDEEDSGMAGADNYEILVCMGCDVVTFRHMHWFSEDTDETGAPITHQELYPPRISRAMPEVLSEAFIHPNWRTHRELRDLTLEIYSALTQGSIFLASMGCRSLLERIMVQEVGDQGSFAQNLDAFFRAGHISKIQKEQLEAAIEAGHAATHRMFRPTVEDLGVILDIIEGVIIAVYVHPERAKLLRAKVPPRQRPNRTLP